MLTGTPAQLATTMKSRLRARRRKAARKNEILNRWAKHQPASQIKHELDLRGRDSVSLVVREARARGDFRAIHHRDWSGRIIGRYRHSPPEEMRV